MLGTKDDQYNRKYGEVSRDTKQRFLDMLDDKKIKDKDVKTLKERAYSLMKLMRYSHLDFILYMEPEASPRPRMGRFGTFYVKGARHNSEFFEEALKTLQENFDKINTACQISMDIYIPIPNDMPKIEAVLAEVKLIRPIVRPDWDNFGKTYSDMIQKHLLCEDSLVVDGRVRKFYSMKPRIELRFTYQDSYDSNYNKKKVEKWNAHDDSYIKKEVV